MLNDTYIKKESYGNVGQILFAIEHQVSVGVQVAQAVGVDNGEGKLIAKAGTPLSGDLDARETEFTSGTDAGVQGVLLHDVDVTRGANNGTLLLFGFVNTNRLEDDVKEKITAEIKAALPMIKFIAC